MNIAQEINKVLNILQVPISDIKFKSSYAEIYSGGANIGNLPIYSPASIISYDSSEALVNKLNWSVIYKKYQDDFLTAIAGLLSNEDIWITPATFGHVYANDKKDNGNVGLFKCSYDGKKWTVIQIR